MAEKQAPQEISGSSLPWNGVRQVNGGTDATGLRIGLVAGRYNQELTLQMVHSAIEAILSQGGSEKDLVVVWVPGAYEISSTLEKLAGTLSFDALIGLGVVIEGETPHAELINQQLSHALATISREHGIPVIDGIIPARTAQQAEERCAKEQKNRGHYYGLAAIEMARVFSTLDEINS